MFTNENYSKRINILICKKKQESSKKNQTKNFPPPSTKLQQLKKLYILTEAGLPAQNLVGNISC